MSSGLWLSGGLLMFAGWITSMIKAVDVFRRPDPDSWDDVIVLLAGGAIVTGALLWRAA